MARYENETQSMIEDPPNLQCRNYPLATTSMIISLTDIPWYPPYTPDASHYHNCLEIGLCLSGEGMAEMGGGRWHFSEGSLLMAPKGVYHAQHNAGDPFTHWRYIAVDSDRMLAQAPHWCAKSIREAMQTTWHNGLYLPPGDEDGARAASIMHTMFDLERSGGNVLPELEAYLLLLLTGLAHLRSREKEMNVMAGVDAPLVPPALEPALLYVSQHYAEEILVEQMARSCAMSESHFRRMFTTLVGISPLEYINRYRIHRSLNLLRSTSEPIQNIAARTGFPSITTFNRDFQRCVGQNPSVWRKNAQKAHEWACGGKQKPTAHRKGNWTGEHC